MNETFRLLMTGCSGDKLWNYFRQLPKFYMVDPKNNKEKGFCGLQFYQNYQSSENLFMSCIGISFVALS